MAGDVSLTFRVTGTPEVLGAFQQIASTARVSGQEVTQAASMQAQGAKEATTAISGATRASVDQQRALGGVSDAARGFRQTFMAVASAIAGAAAVASLFARDNEHLRRQIEVVSLTLSALSTVIGTVGSALRLLALNPVTLVIGALVGLIAVGIAVVKHWDEVKAAAIRIWGAVKDWFARFLEGLGTSLHGLGQILAGVWTIDPAQIKAGWGELTSGLGMLKNVAVDAGKFVITQLGNAWDYVTGLFGTKTKQTSGAVRDAVRQASEAIQTLMQREMAYADTIESTSAKLAIKTMVTKQAVDALERMDRTVAKTKEEHALFQTEIDKLRNQLVGLQDDLYKTTRAYQVHQAVMAQRAGERAPEPFLADPMDALRDADRAIDSALRKLDEARALHRMTADEELAALEAILATEAMTADKRIALEQRVQTIKVQLAQDTAALIALANQQGIDRSLAAEQAAYEKTKALISEEAAVRMAAYQDRLAEIEELARRGEISKTQQIAAIEEVMQAIRAQLDTLSAFREAVSSLTAEEAAPFAPLLAMIPNLQGLLKQLGVNIRDLKTDLKSFAGAMTETFGTFAQYVSSIVGVFQSVFADFFHAVISGAKSFTHVFRDLMKSIWESIARVLANLAANAVVALVLSFFTGGAGFWATFMRWFQMLSFGSVLGKQTGGEFRVTKPTLMMVGEAGPEQVRVFPSGTRESLGKQTGGEFRVTKPTLMMVGEAGPEQVSRGSVLSPPSGQWEWYEGVKGEGPERHSRSPRHPYPESELARRQVGYPVPAPPVGQESGVYGYGMYAPTTINLNFSGMTTMDEIQAAKLGRRLGEIQRREQRRTFVRT